MTSLCADRERRYGRYVPAIDHLSAPVRPTNSPAPSNHTGLASPYPRRGQDTEVFSSLEAA